MHGQRVRLSFARGYAPPPPRHRSAHAVPSLHSSNSIAAVALEQAQWSLANGYSGSNQQQEPTLDSEVTSFLEAVVASAAPPPPPAMDRPKKQWPLPFETGGGRFVFVSDLGLYYDADSMFYYDTQSKLYYSAFSGEYFSCHDGANGALATFALFTPPAPIDDALYAASTVTTATATTTTTATSSGSGGAFSLTLSKKEKKKPLAFGAVMGSSIAAANKLKDAFSGDQTVPTVPSLKRKSADDIAKWSQLQRVAKDATSEKPPAPLASPAAAAALDTLVSVAAEAPVCLVRCPSARASEYLQDCVLSRTMGWD